MMELRHLRYFRAVAEELNMTRAAKRLYIAQPPLTRQIKQLEAELGVRLFDRHARGITLTAAGRYFQGQVVAILERVDTAVAGARTLAGAGEQALRIGFVPSFLYEELPTLIQRLRARHDVAISLTELMTIEQAQALKSDRIDIGFGRFTLDDSEIEQELLFEEPLVAVLPVGHRLAVETPTLAALAAEPLIVYPHKPRPSYADSVLAMFHDRALDVTVVQEANSLQTALGLAASGMGFTLVPERVQRLRREGVIYRPLAERGVTSPVLLSRRKGACSNLTSELLDLLHELVSKRHSTAVDSPG